MAKTVKKVAVVIKDREQLTEGLRTTAGLLLENHTASMFVLDVAIEATDKYLEDLEFLREMDGTTYSNLEANAERLGFELLTAGEIIEKLRESDLLIPF